MRKCNHADKQKKLVQLAKVRFIKCCILPPIVRGVVVYATSNGICPIAKKYLQHEGKEVYKYKHTDGPHTSDVLCHSGLPPTVAFYLRHDPSS